MIKKIKSSSKINWFWAHQRNMTLLHIDLGGKGFRGKGYHPKLRFDFDNQIFVYKPGKGIYLFYDRDLMKKRMLQLQEDIQKHGTEVISYFHKKTNRFFGHLLMIGRDIVNTNLELKTNKELKELFQDFKEAITIGPIITIQLWGIESCWLEESELTKFLKKKLKKKEKEFALLKQELSASIGKTVAYAEREEFLRMLIEISKKKVLKEVIIEGTVEDIKRILTNTKEEGMIKKHMKKYGWITAEYKSIPWNFERWILTTKENIKDCKENLSKQIEEYKQKFEEKKILVKKLKPPEKVMKVIRFLDECNAQRDWSKGKFCEAYLYLRSLTDEIARRFNLSFEEIYSMKVEEIEMMLDGKPINKNIIRARLEKGQILLIKEGKEEMHEPMTMKQVMKQEGIYDFFHKKEIFTEARGLPACKGFTKGRARVIDSSKGIPEFIEGEILVTYMTTMEFTPLFSKAKAIVCDEGGISSHAAIVSREFGIPCIVGAKIAMKFIKTGDLIEVDANKGVVRILKHFSHS